MPYPYQTANHLYLVACIWINTLNNCVSVIDRPFEILSCRCFLYWVFYSRYLQKVHSNSLAHHPRFCINLISLFAAVLKIISSCLENQIILLFSRLVRVSRECNFLICYFDLNDWFCWWKNYSRRIILEWPSKKEYLKTLDLFSLPNSLARLIRCEKNQ